MSVVTSIIPQPGDPVWVPGAGYDYRAVVVRVYITGSVTKVVVRTRAGTHRVVPAYMITYRFDGVEFPK